VAKRFDGRGLRGGGGRVLVISGGLEKHKNRSICDCGAIGREEGKRRRKKKQPVRIVGTRKGIPKKQPRARVRGKGIKARSFGGEGKTRGTCGALWRLSGSSKRLVKRRDQFL